MFLTTTTDIQNFNQNLLHHIVENCISDYEDISAIENQDENLFTGAFFFTRDMTQNKNDLSLMKHYLNHINKDDLHRFYALYKFTFEIDEQLSFRFFNLNEQMDNVLRSSALSSDINFTDKDVQVYLFNQSQSSIKLIKVTEITKLSNLKDFFIMKTANNNSSTTTLLFLDIDGVINNYQSHVKMENIFDDCEKFFKREVNHFTKEQNDFLLSEMKKNDIRLCFTKTDFHLQNDLLFPYFGFIDLNFFKKLISKITHSNSLSQNTDVNVDVVIISSWGCGLKSQFPNQEKQFYLDIFNNWLNIDNLNLNINLNVIDIVENTAGVAKVRLEQAVQFLVENYENHKWSNIVYADDTFVSKSDVLEISNNNLISEFSCYQDNSDKIRSLTIKSSAFTNDLNINKNKNKFLAIEFLLID